MTHADTALRLFSFFGAMLSAVVLFGLTVARIKHREFTPGEIVVRLGFIALLASVVYGTGEQLWHWYHLRTWILALAVFWTGVGVALITREYLAHHKEIQ